MENPQEQLPGEQVGTESNEGLVTRLRRSLARSYWSRVAAIAIVSGALFMVIVMIDMASIPFRFPDYRATYHPARPQNLQYHLQSPSLFFWSQNSKIHVNADSARGDEELDEAQLFGSFVAGRNGKEWLLISMRAGELDVERYTDRKTWEQQVVRGGGQPSQLLAKRKFFASLPGLPSPERILVRDSWFIVAMSVVSFIVYSVLGLVLGLPLGFIPLWKRLDPDPKVCGKSKV